MTDKNHLHPNNTICARVMDLIPAYSIGATDPDETRFVEANLDACPEARAELESFAGVNAGLLHLVPENEAPPPVAGLLDRLHEDALPSSDSTPVSGSQVRPVPRLVDKATGPLPQAGPLADSPASGPLPFPLPTPEIGAQAVRASQPLPLLQTRMRRTLLLPLVAAAAVLLLLTNVYWLTQVQRLRDDQADLRAQLAAQQQDDIMIQTQGEDHHRELLAAQTGHAGAHATVIWRSDAEVGSLLATNLPLLEPEFIYQFWLVRGDEEISLGTFRVDENGTGTLVFQSPQPITSFDAMGISVEPAHGSEDPTTPHLVIGEI